MELAGQEADSSGTDGGHSAPSAFWPTQEPCPEGQDAPPSAAQADGGAGASPLAGQRPACWCPSPGSVPLYHHHPNHCPAPPLLNPLWATCSETLQVLGTSLDPLT